MNGQGKRSKDFSSTKKLILPEDTASILKNEREIENLNLRFYRYAYIGENKSGGSCKIELRFPCAEFKIPDVYRPILTNLNERIQNVWEPIKIQDKPFVVSQQSR